MAMNPPRSIPHEEFLSLCLPESSISITLKYQEDEQQAQLVDLRVLKEAGVRVSLNKLAEPTTRCERLYNAGWYWAFGTAGSTTIEGDTATASNAVRGLIHRIDNIVETRPERHLDIDWWSDRQTCAIRGAVCNGSF